MHVAVLELLGRRLADVEHLHREVEGLAGQGVVRVDRDLVAIDIDDRYDLRAFVAVGLELHAGRHFGLVAEIFLGNLEYQGLVALAIPFGGRHHAFHGVARLLAFEVLLQAGNDVFVPVEVDQRLAAVGGIEELARRVTETVVDRDDLILLNVHKRSFYGLLLPRLARTGRSSDLPTRYDLYYNKIRAKRAIARERHFAAADH
jgi:hypothetical protein